MHILVTGRAVLMAGNITGNAVPHSISTRRSGGPACPVADANGVFALLDWVPNASSLQSILETSWNWTIKLHGDVS